MALLILNDFFLKEPEDLFETISQALLNAVDRDAVSGWGAVVHIMLVLNIPIWLGFSMA